MYFDFNNINYEQIFKLPEKKHFRNTNMSECEIVNTELRVEE